MERSEATKRKVEEEPPALAPSKSLPTSSSKQFTSHSSSSSAPTFDHKRETSGTYPPRISAPPSTSATSEPQYVVKRQKVDDTPALPPPSKKPLSKEASRKSYSAGFINRQKDGLSTQTTETYESKDSQDQDSEAKQFQKIKKTDADEAHHTPTQEHEPLEETKQSHKKKKKSKEAEAEEGDEKAKRKKVCFICVQSKLASGGIGT